MTQRPAPVQRGVQRLSRRRVLCAGVILSLAAAGVVLVALVLGLFLQEGNVPAHLGADSIDEHACRFWGMIATDPPDSLLYDQLISGTYSFQALGGTNPDGWGVAYFASALMPPPVSRPQLLHGGPPADHAYDDGFPQAVSEMLTLDAHCGCAHVRAASPGHTGIPDPHPFWREDLLFAHNGWVDVNAMVTLLEEDDPGYFDTHPTHYTSPYLDSELLLLYLLKIRDQGVGANDRPQSHALGEVTREAIFRVFDAGAIRSAANCLITSGDTLVAVRFDPDDEERYRVRYLQIEDAWVVCSEPVGSDTTGWLALPPKTLGVFTVGAPPVLLKIFPPPGPYLVVDTTTVDDDMQGGSYGNGDGNIDAGETIELGVLLRNEGTQSATGISATIATADTCCQITDDYEEYPEIAPGGVAPCLEDFDLIIDPQCPDGHQVLVTMTIQADSAYVWEREFLLEVHAPEVALDGYTVNDLDDGRIDPGETILLSTTLANVGSEQLTTLAVELQIDHPAVTILAGEAALDTLDAGGIGIPTPPFRVEVHDSFPAPDAIAATLAITADWGVEARVDFLMPVGGFYDGMESGPGSWTHYIVTDGFHDQWHLSSEDNYTPGGAWSWKFGDSGTGSYLSLCDGALESESVSLRRYTYLRFRHWIEAETSEAYPGYCYDGGLVEISVNDSAWTQIHPIGGYPYVVRNVDGTGPFPPDTGVYSGEIDWAWAIFPIVDAQGEARFRFRFGSDDSITREGWYIDEVEIFGTDGPWQDVDEGTPLILHPAVGQSCPNPSGPGVAIPYRLPDRQAVRLQIFDAQGRLVRTLVDGSAPAGFHRALWDGRDDAGTPSGSGAYFYRFETRGLTATRKLLLIR